MTANILAAFSLVIGFVSYQNVAGQISGLSLLKEITKRPELSRYRSWLQRSQREDLLDGGLRFTIFAPNNTAFEQMTPEKRQRFERMDMEAIGNYLLSLAVHSVQLQTSSMQDESVQISYARNQEKLFIAVKPSSGGLAGVNQYYVNGARIINSDIRCSNGILQIIDDIPEPASNQFVFGYLTKPDIPTLRMTLFYTTLLRYLPETQYNTIADFKTSPKLTLFVPSDEAIQKIPENKLAELRGNPELLNRVVRRHYIKNQAIHTSWIIHRQQFTTENRDEKIVFRKIKTDNYPERVYVMSEGVNALVTFGNITVANGVIHIVDSVLGYKYNSAMEQLNSDNSLNSFSSILQLASPDLQNILRDQQGSQQVTVFAPTNEAIQAIENLPGVNFQSNRTLTDMVIRYHVLEVGNVLVVMDVNRQYESREMRRTMYQGNNVVIYQRYNETFVEAGYVRARVVRPDVGVTNGYVQYIDRVFGVPSKDIPTTMCEDRWIRKSYLVLNSISLGELLRDRGLAENSPGRTCQLVQYNYNQKTPNNQFPQNTQNNENLNLNNANNQPRSYRNYENVPQQFTVFIANGSVFEYFEQTNLGRAIMKDDVRYRWVLRRHIIPGRAIYMDKLAQGDHIFTTHNEEEIIVKKNGFGIRTYVEVIFGRKRAQVIHMDLGATNGVVHILRDILAVDEDRTRYVEDSSPHQLSLVSMATLILVAMIIQLF